MSTNSLRVIRMLNVLHDYADNKAEPEIAMIARHWCRWVNCSFRELDRIARMHFEAEVEGDPT